MQNTLRTVRVNPAFVDGRGRARSFVKAEIVVIPGGIIKAPKRFARARLEAFDYFLVINAMEENQFTFGNNRTAEALAHFFLPNRERPFFGPFPCQLVRGVNAVACRAEELRPI